MKQFNSLFSRSQFVLLFFLSFAFLLLMIGSAFVLLWFLDSEATPATVVAPLIGYLVVGSLLIFAIIMLLILRRVNQLFTAHLSVEEALRISEQRHRTLLEAIPDIVLRRKRNGVYTDFKPAKHFGRFIPHSEFIGKNMTEFLPPDVVEVSMAASERALASGVEQTYHYRMPNRQTGALRDYEGRVVPVNEDEVQVIIPNRAELQLPLADMLPVVNVDRSQLQQVMMNLVLNAAEALGNTGGYVRIRTEVQTLAASPGFSHYFGDALPSGHSSGYTETEIHHLHQETSVVAFLPKPYSFAQLTAAIHDALHHLACVAPVEAAE